MTSESRRVATRLLGFTGWPLLTLVTPLLATPTLARLTGQGWSSIGSAISIGTFGAAAVLWGWNYVGPARVARLSTTEEHNRLYFGSVVSRLLLSAVVLPACAAVSAWVALPSLRLAAAATAVAFALPALSPQWYCIGIGSSRLLGYFDTLPRTLATLVAVPLMVVTREVLVYPVMLTIGILVSLVWFRHHVFAGQRAHYPTIARAWADVRSMSSVAGANLTGAAYGYTPTPIATASLTPLVSSQFASADQLYRWALFFVQALGNALQGWVLEVRGDVARRRQHLAVAAHGVLGVVGGLGLALLSPWVSSLLFGPDIAATYAVSAWNGLAFASISLATPLLRNVLIPHGRERVVLAATVVAAVAGLAVMGVGAAMTSPAVIAAGMACSELAILLVVLRPSRRVLAAMGGSGGTGAVSESE